MFPRADLALYNRDGQLIAVVEVKNKLGTSAIWAAQLRRNILAHGGFQNAPYFLLMTPDRIYLWKDAGTDLSLSLQPMKGQLKTSFHPILIDRL